MKTRIWLLLAVMAFGLLTAIRPASARGVQVPPPDRARINQLLARSGPAVESAPGHGKGTHSARQGRKNPVASDNPVELTWCDLRPQPNRQGQADDDQDGGGEVNLALFERQDPPPEWRMTRPDPLRANSFINAKAKPPPRGPPQTKPFLQLLLFLLSSRATDFPPPSFSRSRTARHRFLPAGPAASCHFLSRRPRRGMTALTATKPPVAAGPEAGAWVPAAARLASPIPGSLALSVI